MTDPLALAEEIEREAEAGPHCADKAHRHVAITVTEADARLLAAALRFAEASDRYATEARSWSLQAVGYNATRVAYRKAKEES